MNTIANEAALLSAIYTLTPTHCGTGQTTGAIDLPIAREAHTGFPILPASSLKGVARDVFEENLNGKSRPDVSYLFGPNLDQTKLNAGALIFSEGRLVLLPVRSLTRSFMYVTCPLIIERLERDLRALGLVTFLPDERSIPDPQPGQAQVADPDVSGKAIVLEELVYQPNEVGHLDQIGRFANSLANLLPDSEERTRERIRRNVIVIRDEDMSALVERAIPVQARIRLTSGKTTSRYNTDTGQEETGNLWYEETLPPDSFFVSFIVGRDQNTISGARLRSKESPKQSPLAEFLEHADTLRFVQIGGNASVGNGWCWWSLPPKDALAAQNKQYRGSVL
jgi:CRISPR-associated protein Cmr4